MSKNIYKDLSNEDLLKKKAQFKGLSIAFGIGFIVIAGVLIYILVNKSTTKVSFATLLPMFTLPITFLPVLINISLLNKELKSRNI